MNRWLGFGLLLALLVALALRYPALDARPVHNDEALNAFKLKALWEQGHYVYNPHEFHGPALYYASLPFLVLSPARSFAQVDETTLRLPTVFFGVLLILLVALLHDGLGRTATFCAGALIALSPAMVFYSRYFIHEMPLICSTGLVLGAGWRYSQTRQWRWALLTGVGLGLMGTTKETFVFSIVAMAVAGALTALLSRWPEPPATHVRLPWDERHVIGALLAVLVVWVVLFTSFFSNLLGVFSSVRAFWHWADLAGSESPHAHPWNFYFERLLFYRAMPGPVWSEGAILLLAAVGMVAALLGRGLGEIRLGLARFLTFYTLTLTAIYCWIPYKTPWCALNFLFGFILMAGIGAAALLQWCRKPAERAGIAVLLALVAVHLGWQAWRLSHVEVVSRGNPYVYAQTAPDMVRLGRQVEGIAAVAPEGHDTVVKIMAPEHDYGPLLWYLRRFNNTGWWDKVPEQPFAPIILASTKLEAGLDDKSDEHQMVGLFEMRPGVFFELYVEAGLWQKYIATLPNNRE